MIDAARTIRDYLPLRQPILTDIYIGSLWDALERLTDHENPKTQGFAVAPFHLLFMTAVQYKALRLYNEMQSDYLLAFTLVPISEDKKKVLLNPKDVFDLSLLHERTLFSLFEIVGLDANCIMECKRIINDRNQSLMHATGSLPTNAEDVIENYITQLDAIQQAFIALNDRVADELITEFEPGESQKEFLEKHLFLRSLTRADFARGKLRAQFGQCMDEEI